MSACRWAFRLRSVQNSGHILSVTYSFWHPRVIYLLLRLPVMSQCDVSHLFSPNTLIRNQKSLIQSWKPSPRSKKKAIDIFTSSFFIYSSHVLPPLSPVFMFAAISKLSPNMLLGSHVHVKLYKSSSFATNKDWRSPPPSNHCHSRSLRGEMCRKHCKECCPFHLSQSVVAQFPGFEWRTFGAAIHLQISKPTNEIIMLLWTVVMNSVTAWRDKRASPQDDVIWIVLCSHANTCPEVATLPLNCETPWENKVMTIMQVHSKVHIIKSLVTQADIVQTSDKQVNDDVIWFSFSAELCNWIEKRMKVKMKVNVGGKRGRKRGDFQGWRLGLHDNR